VPTGQKPANTGRRTSDPAYYGLGACGLAGPILAAQAAVLVTSAVWL